MQIVKSQTQRLKSDALLLLASILWGSGFVAQRIASASMGSFMFNAGRFLLGAVFVFAVTGFKWRGNRSQLRGIALTGVLLFLASLFQQMGIETTTAGNAGFITSLYVVIIPLFLMVFGKKKIQPAIWLAVGMAVLGALLLSTGGKFEPAPGDWLMLISAFFWAGQVLLVGHYGSQSDSLAFTIGEFTIAAVLNLIFALVFEFGNYQPLPEAWWSILYSAAVPVGIGFTLQVIGQRYAPPIHAALIFSLEAVFAALAGYLVLNERLLPIQLLGCGLILLAIILAQVNIYKSSAANAQIEPVSQDIISENLQYDEN